MNSVRACFILAFLAAGMSLAPIQSRAQFVVKRVSCTNLKLGWPNTFHPFYFNDTGSTRRIHLQITRNGCRPRDLSIQFGYSNNLPSSATATSGDPVSGRQPYGQGYIVPDDHYAVLYFWLTPPDHKVSGTFDYMYTVD